MTLRGWLRRNRLALAALVVVIPAAVVVIGGQEWITYYGYRPYAPVDVAEGDRIDFAGATFGPAQVRDVTGAHRDGIPDGARVLAAEFTVVPGESAPGCTVSLREAGGAQRHWVPSGMVPDWSGDTFCPTDAAGPYDVSTPFVVPADAAGPFLIEVIAGDEAPRYLRLTAG